MGNIIVLVIFGVVLAYIFKSYANFTNNEKKATHSFSVSYEAIKNSELGLFVALVAKVAKADGRIDALEAQLVGMMFDDISNAFDEPQKTKDILKQIFEEEKVKLDDTQHIAQQLAHITKRDKAKHHQFMGFLIQLAFADGEVSENEEEMLSIIAEAMEFDPTLYHKIFDQFESMMQNIQPQASLDDAYELLGVSKNDDMSTIKKAYRKLVRKYHPDIVKSQTQDEAYLEEATRKTQEINQAYEMIKDAKK